jgi:uncharacterized protein YggE
LRQTLAALAFAFVVAPTFVHPAAAEEKPVARLTATGTGIVSTAPDMASVTLGVVSEAKTAADALAQNSKDMAAAIAAIKAAGVAEKDIATTGFNVGPIYNNPPTKSDGSSDAPKIVGYQVSNQVRVVIRDLTKAGTVLDAVVKAGANQAASIEFGLADPKAATETAIRAAIADAKDRARAMAGAAGVKLVRVLSVDANENGIRRYQVDLAEMAKEAPAAPVMAGERQITASATLVYEIEPK